MNKKITIVQMNPRRRFLTAKAISELGLLEALHVHSSVFGKGLRIKTLALEYFDKKSVRNNFENLFKIQGDYNFFHYDSPLIFIKERFFGNIYSYNKKMVQYFCKKVRKNISPSQNVYAFSGCALEIFEQQTGLCVLDQVALLPLDEVELLSRSAKPDEQWVAHMNYLHSRNLEEIDRADVVLCLYQQIEDSIKRWRPDAKTMIINHPCDVPKPKPLQKNKRLKFLFAGTKSIGKGVNLIEQWILQSNRSQAIDFIICGGEGNYSLQKIEGRENVRILPHQNRDQLNELYRTVDLCLFPEQQNALGNTAFEAMEHGTPVLARKNEILANGVNGFTFENDEDFFEIIENLSKLESIDFYRVGKNALKITKERHINFKKEIFRAIYPE